MALKAFVMSSESADATPFYDTMASALIRFIASTLKVVLAIVLSGHLLRASRLVAIILSRSLPTSS